MKKTKISFFQATEDSVIESWSKLALRSINPRIKANRFGEDFETEDSVKSKEIGTETTSSAETASRLLALALLIRLNLTSFGFRTALWLDITWNTKQ
jgi:hypothetical protein